MAYVITYIGGLLATYPFMPIPPDIHIHTTSSGFFASSCCLAAAPPDTWFAMEDNRCCDEDIMNTVGQARQRGKQLKHNDRLKGYQE